MPTFSNVVDGVNLPIEKTDSSIKKPDGKVWEYPSPLQFYNALVRKGWYVRFF
jgi:hypothetical protein